MGDPGFWDDAGRAAKIAAEHARVTRRLEIYRGVERDVEDLDALVELSRRTLSSPPSSRRS